MNGAQIRIKNKVRVFVTKSMEYHVTRYNNATLRISSFLIDKLGLNHLMEISLETH